MSVAGATCAELSGLSSQKRSMARRALPITVVVSPDIEAR